MGISEQKQGLVDQIETKDGLVIEVWGADLKHALEVHPEVNIERIKDAIINPIRVVKSKKNYKTCLFYSCEIENFASSENLYFCVVVSVLSALRGKMETAYETTYIKSGNVLYKREGEK